MGKAFQNVLYAIGARGGIALTSLCLTFLLPKFFPAEDVGFFYFLVSQATLVSVFLRYGVDYSVMTDVANKKTNESSITWSGILIIFSMAMPACALLSAFSLFLDTSQYFLAFILGAGIGLNLFFSQLYKVHGNIFLASASRGLSLNLSVLAAVLLLALLDMALDIGRLIQVASFIFILMTVVNLVFYIKSKIGSFEINTAAMSGLFSRSHVFFRYSLIVFFIGDLDYWLINIYLNAEDLAVYATIKRVAILLAVFVDLANLVLPKLYKDSSFQGEELNKVVTLSRRVSLTLFFLGVCVCVCSAAFGESAIKLLWGEAYLTGYSPMLVLLATFTMVLLFGFSEIFLILKGEKEILFRGMLGMLIVMLAMNLLLINPLQMLGCALSFFISNVFYRAYLTYNVWRIYKINLFSSWS